MWQMLFLKGHFFSHQGKWIYKDSGGKAVNCGLLASFFYVFPYVGSLFGLIAYVTVALGGFGSIPGSLAAGIIIGLIEVLGGLLIAPAFKYVAVFLIYLIVVLIRPQGLFGKF